MMRHAKSLRCRRGSSLLRPPGLTGAPTYRRGTLAILMLMIVSATAGAAPAAPEEADRDEPTVEEASGKESDAGDQAPTEEPLTSEHVEEVSVASDRGGDSQAPTGMASTVVDPQDVPIISDGVAGYAATVPGVSENGQGGLFQSIAIRGTARQRILQVMDGVRLTSERRAGAAASFLDPLLVGSLDVLRGPASSAYGPGALGGVVQVFPRHFTGPEITAGYFGEGDTTVLQAGGGGEHFSVGVARRDAGNGETASGEERNSAFTQWSATIQGLWGKGPRQYRLSYLPSLGEEIGKPNSDYPDRVTVYPEEQHHLLRFVAEGDGGWEASAWLHPSALETRVSESDGTVANVDHESLDLGARWRQRHTHEKSLATTWGVETFHRRGVNITEVTQPPPGNGPAVTQQPLDDAAADEIGLFGDVSGTWGTTRWQAGARGTWIEQRNQGAEDRDDTAGSGFFGAIVPLTARLSFKGHAGSGWRFPTLTERFFTGTTGRGQVVGNPDLQAERSFGLEAGLQWVGRRVLFSGSLFHTRISNFIDRVEIAPDLLTFINLTSGTLVGVEVEGAWHGDDGWHAGWGGHLMQGRDDDDQPLADVSPDEIFAGLGRNARRWGFNTRLGWRAAKNDPGSGEMSIASATLFSGSAFWRLSGAWRLELRGMNLLDEAYFPSADDRAQEAPGRTFGLLVTWSGG